MRLYFAEGGWRRLNELLCADELTCRIPHGYDNDFQTHYLDLAKDLYDPSFWIDPKILGLIEKITVKCCVYHGFVRDGRYTEDGVTVDVNTEVVVERVANGDKAAIVKQQIFMCGPTIEVVRKVYSRVRQKLIEPTEPWSDGPPPELSEYVIARSE